MWDSRRLEPIGPWLGTDVRSGWASAGVVIINSWNFPSRCIPPPPPKRLKAFAESGAAEAMSMPFLQHKLHAAWKRCQGQFWTRAVVRSHGSIYHVWPYRRILHIPLSLIVIKEENSLNIN